MINQLQMINIANFMISIFLIYNYLLYIPIIVLLNNDLHNL